MTTAETAAPRSGDLLVAAMLAAYLTLISVAASTATLGIGALALLLAGGTSSILLLLIHRLAVGREVSIFLLVPTLMSVAQNLYLLPAADVLADAHLQPLLALNFLFAATLLGVLWAFKGRATRPLELRRVGVKVALTAALITLWGFALALTSEGGSLVAAFASYRNAITPFLFLGIGLLAAPWVDLRWLLRLLLWLGVAVIAFGLYELTADHFWQNTALDVLWEKKGLPVNPVTGLPDNFYSSETLNGRQIRRMVSSFADPVNLGTFLFVVLATAWYLRSHFAYAATLAAVALTVSKGALLGVLISLAVGARVLLDRTIATIAAGVALAAGAWFYLFQQANSTGSTAAHIDGFLAALVELPQHPLGRGYGSTGVLAGLFTDEGAESAIAESGIGMILGQLGVVGLVAYVILFRLLIRASLRVGDPRTRALAITLTLAFLANATFNEVALSPNSAAPYFVILGVIIGQDLSQRPRAEEPESDPATRQPA